MYSFYDLHQSLGRRIFSFSVSLGRLLNRGVHSLLRFFKLRNVLLQIEYDSDFFSDEDLV